jgi:hypothetical protein
MKKDSLKHVKKKNSLKKFSNESEIFKHIIEEVKSLENYQELKGNVDLIEYVCNLVEEYVNNKNKKGNNRVDKKQLVTRIFIQLFNLSVADEIKVINNQIEFLHANNLIKGVSRVAKVGFFLLSLVKK